MKGKFITLLTMVMILALTGQAFAYFDARELVLNVYYNGSPTGPTGSEIAIDLNGAASGLLNLSAQNVTLAAAGTVNLGSLGLSNWSDGVNGVFAGAWAKDTAQTFASFGDAYFATSMNTAPVLAAPSGFFSGLASQYTYYHGSSSSVFVGPNSAGSSYDMKSNLGSRSPGNYGGVNASSGNGNGEADLRGFDAEGNQFVDLYLWHIYRATSSSPATYVGTSAAAVLRIMENGSVVLNPNAVPIPAGFLLFGSGLLGLIGLRRKNA